MSLPQLHIRTLLNMITKKNVFGISGFSNSGKTTLIEKLIPLLKEYGLKVAVIKHDGHDFEMDRKGKDTYRFTEAGADTVMISSASRYARLDEKGRTLEKMLDDADEADIVLIEGYKYADVRKIGIAVSWLDYRLPCNMEDYEAVAVDDKMRFIRSLDRDSAGRVNGLSVFDINDPKAVADYIINTSCINKEQGRDKEQEKDFTHFDGEGNARMVDVSDKNVTHRKASAHARVIVNRTTFELIKNGGIKKGDVLTVAQIAGIMGAKRTPDLIPMCHPIVTDGTELRLTLNEETLSVDIESSVSCTGRTGVEMEAICACTVAAMTVYDMCKAVQRDIEITDIRLMSKSGGIHGDYAV